MPFTLLASFAPALAAAEVRIKDIADVEGIREKQLIGYGLVVGLNGAGDRLGNAVFTRQSLIGMLERLGVNTRDQAAQLQTKNVAAVMITANLPAFARGESRIDIAVAAENAALMALDLPAAAALLARKQMAAASLAAKRPPATPTPVLRAAATPLRALATRTVASANAPSPCSRVLGDADRRPAGVLRPGVTPLVRRGIAEPWRNSISPRRRRLRRAAGPLREAPPTYARCARR